MRKEEAHSNSLTFQKKNQKLTYAKLCWVFWKVSWISLVEIFLAKFKKFDLLNINFLSDIFTNSEKKYIYIFKMSRNNSRNTFFYQKYLTTFS